MKQEVIFVLLNQYADRALSYLNTVMHNGLRSGAPVKYGIRTLSITKEKSYLPYLN